MAPPISSMSPLTASTPIPSPASLPRPTSTSSTLAVAPCNASSAPPCHAAAPPSRRGLLALGAGFLASAALLGQPGDAEATRIEYYATVGDKMCDMSLVKSGLAYCDVEVGTGAQPPRGELVNIHYTARFPDGTVFDSSYKRGKPLTFRVGVGEVIKGWDQGIVGGEGIPPMLAGGKRTLRLPPQLAYGEKGAGCRGWEPTSCVIPPNSTLLFDVEYVGRVIS